MPMLPHSVACVYGDRMTYYLGFDESSPFHAVARLMATACGTALKGIKNFSISKRSFEIGESLLVLFFRKEHPRPHFTPMSAL